PGKEALGRRPGRDVDHVAADHGINAAFQRPVGASILASAGIAGLVVALAARPTLENIFAGLQLAFTEPIRIDDVVIIAGEWGRIEEITSTYVVVKVWDERRLIVPFSKFLQEPFQNWTRTTADILGTVMIHCDYSVPVDEVRAELKRIVEGHDAWDGRVCGLQVTESSERTMGLRALVSAADASAAWNLRCDVREKLIVWLQENHPGALPRVRAQLQGALQTSESGEGA
ncbi:MAG: mechanosensitive ion channel family protein, partial [Phycisphaerales bacterium JB039]